MTTDLIQIGTSALLGHEKALRTVGNNLANVNTPGFKSSQAQFASLFDQGTGQHSAGTGGGMEVLGNNVSFVAGVDQTTGNPLQLRIDGDGFFAVQRNGQTLYTRAGDFQFNSNGVLVNAEGDHVMAFNSGGSLEEVKIDQLAQSMPKATQTVKFAGNLTTTVATPPVNANVTGIKVIDAAGGSHNLNMSFHNNGDGTYALTVTDPAAPSSSVGTGTLGFTAGFPTAATSTFTFTYSPSGSTPFDVTFDFGSSVTALSSATTLTALSQDGYSAGTLTGATIGSDGAITISYSNGQTKKGQTLALANFGAVEDLEEAGGSAFVLKRGACARYGYAGQEGYGSLVAGHLEGSNVDMAEEFSNLILMQRGYQAASHVISTANDLIQELFDMKGNR